MILNLNKNTHSVYSAISVLDDTKCTRHHHEDAAVTLWMSIDGHTTKVSFCRTCYIDFLEGENVLIEVI